MNIAWPIGGIIGPLVSGYSIDSFGWRFSFMVAVSVGAFSILPSLLVRETRSQEKADEQKSKDSSILERRYLLPLLLFFGFHLAMTTALGGVNTILPLFLSNQLNLSYHLIGLFFTGFSLLTLLTQIPSGVLADKFGRKKLTLTCISAIPILYSLWIFPSNWIILLFLYSAAWGLWSMTWPATLALLSDTVPKELRGTAFGVRMTPHPLSSARGLTPWLFRPCAQPHQDSRIHHVVLEKNNRVH